MENQAGFIPGMKFVPHDHELLLFYLTKKMRGEPLPWVGIRDFDVYGERGPWEMVHYGGETSPSSSSSSSSSEPVYVFAISKNKSAKMKQRTCDFGTWKLQSNTPVYHQNQIIGSRAYLSFMPKKGVDPSLLGGNWNMTEYSLPGSEDKDCYVICKVSFKVWTEKERSKGALEENMSPAAGSDIDPTWPRKRAKVICGSNNWERAPCARAFLFNNSNPTVVVPCSNNGDLGSNNKVDEYLNSSSNVYQEEEPASFNPMMDRGVGVQASNNDAHSPSSYLFSNQNESESVDALILESNIEETCADDPFFDGNIIEPASASGTMATDDVSKSADDSSHLESNTESCSDPCSADVIERAVEVDRLDWIDDMMELESTDDIVACFGAEPVETSFLDEYPVCSNNVGPSSSRTVVEDFLSTSSEGQLSSSRTVVEEFLSILSEGQLSYEFDDVVVPEDCILRDGCLWS